MSAETPPKGWGHRIRRAIAWTVIVLSLGLFAIVTWLPERELTAPDWVRHQIETRLTAALPGTAVQFSEMVVTVRGGWRPEVDVRGLRLTGPGGREVLAVSELQVTLAMRPLLNLKIQPKTIDLVGIFSTLRRDRAGQFTLTTSDASAAAQQQAGSFPELVEQIDALFLRPELAALTQMNVQALTLRIEDARSGRAWTVDGGRVRMARDGDDLDMAADLALLSGGADAATLAASYSSQIGSTAAEFGVSLQDVPAHEFSATSPAFAWLDALRAPLTGALRGGIDDAGVLQPVNATLQIGEGALQPTDETRPIEFKSARTYFTFDPDSETLRFDQFALDSNWIVATGDGEATLTGLGEGRLDALVGQFRLSDIAAAPPDFYDAPVEFAGAELDFRLIPSPFRVDLGGLRLIGQEDSLQFDGHLQAAPEGWELALNGALNHITPARLLELWPAAAGQKTRAWLADNLLEAQISNVDFALRSLPDQPVDTYLRFDFDETKLRYAPDMPVIEQARGVGTLLRNRFVVAVEEGQSTPLQGGAIDLAGSSFILPDITIKERTPAVVRLRTDSSVTAALSLLDNEPLRLLSKAGQPITMAEGRAVLETTLALPLLKDLPKGALQFDTGGVLRNVSSDVLVKGQVLKAQELTIRADNDVLSITGDGTLDGLAFAGGWSQKLGQTGSEVTARVALSQDTSDALGLGLPPGTFQGAAPGQLTVSLKKGQAPGFRFASDLKGVRVAIPSLGWVKPAGSTGKLAVSGTLGDVPKVDALALSAPGLEAEGTVSLRAGGGLERARFAKLRVGDWLNAPVDLIGRGKGTAPGIVLRGGTLDLRQAPFGQGGGGEGPLELALNRLQITDTIALTDMSGDFALSGGLQGQFQGRVNGQTPVTGRVEPRGGRSAFLIRSGDAGGVARAAGLLKQGRGGSLELVLQPVGSEGGFNGSLHIENTRVTDAPAIAALMNALSVVGLLEQMNGEGLHFANVDAAFRLTPKRVTLTEASATGPSIGISMEGVYDVNTQRMDMQGVFSPLYLVNGIGSIFTRRGEGLVGFNFRLRGPSSKPKVQVNPLSALTPGIFREIFRRAPPEIAAEPGEVPGQAPGALRPPQKPRKRTVVSGADR